jgi:murein DD-endopeptidase MepM/ murein hydrolase activator NlpD
MHRSLLALLLSAACAGEVAEHGASPDGGGGGGGDDSAPSARGRVTGTAGLGLNLRAQPSTEAEVVALLPEAAIVDLFGDPTDGWYRARHQSDDGYLSAEFIVVLEDGAQDGGVLNLLPWAAETSFSVTQAHGTFSHVGINQWAWDFGMPVGTPVLAAHNGVVRMSRSDGGGGCCDPSCGPQANYVIIERGDGLESAYIHLSEALVAPGEVVTRGDLVGMSGETGYVCGAHLHFQMQTVPADRTTRYGQSVQDYFHDSGAPVDHQEGEEPVSKNGVLDIP